MNRSTRLTVLLLLFACSAVAGTLQVTVEEPAGVPRQQWPVTSGVPLPTGILRDPADTALFDRDGLSLPLQTEVLARWPDGSIRWLLLDFPIDLASKEKKALTLRYGPGTRPSTIDRPIQVRQESARVVVETGVMRLEIPQKQFRPPGNIWLDTNGDGRFSPDERVTDPDSPGVVLVDGEGRRFTSSDAAASLAEISVEQAGPLRACVRIAGCHASDDGRLFRYVARVHAYRGQPFVRFFYTFINDHPDSLMAKLRSIELVFRPSGQAEAAKNVLLDGKSGQTGRLFQVDEDHCELNGQPIGNRGCGWAAIGNEKVGLAVGLREFWQNWPKSIEQKPGMLSIGICPQFPAGLYDGKPLEEEVKLYYALRGGVHTFKVGVARTHELWAVCYAGAPDVAKLAHLFQATEEPLVATPDPKGSCASKALGEFPPADPSKYLGYDAWLDRALEAHLRIRQQKREYGMLNYGDWYGERRVNWGNIEYDLAHGLFVQYLRTGDRRFYLRAEQAARHHMDVDVVHATNPLLKNPWGPPPQVGEIWLHSMNHTGGYYDDKRLPVERTYQMGHSTNFGHVWVSGDLDYYYLTGDRSAREVAVQMADAMARHCPTDYGTHIRSLGWPMILLLSAFDATGDKKYLEATEKNWQVLRKNIDWQKGWVIRLAQDHCAHGDRRCYGNVPFMEGLTLCALARYHRLTGNPEVLKAITVGIDQMIRECWEEEAKMFRYTACPKSNKAPNGLFLSAEAMGYEIALTGNQEHLRVLREGFRAALPKGDGGAEGKSLGQLIRFTPHALTVLEYGK